MANVITVANNSNEMGQACLTPARGSTDPSVGGWYGECDNRSKQQQYNGSGVHDPYHKITRFLLCPEDLCFDVAIGVGLTEHSACLREVLRYRSVEAPFVVGFHCKNTVIATDV